MHQLNAEEHMSSFGTYLIGFILLVVGLAVAASLLGVETTWIAVGAVVLIGIGIMTATSRTKPRDPPPPGSY
jgi:heme/copper-type cytochrome/quinol oxidase subunit 4